MRLSIFFLVIAAFMVEESYAYAASTSCVWVNGKQECTNNMNNGNGIAATSINTVGPNSGARAGPMSNNNIPFNPATAINTGGYGMSCVWINGKQECTSNVNNGNGNAGTSVSCVWINGKQECTNNVNNGNGITGTSMSCVWINGKQQCTKNVYNGSGMSAISVNTGGLNSGGRTGLMPSNNILSNPFQLLNFPQQRAGY